MAGLVAATLIAGGLGGCGTSGGSVAVAPAPADRIREVSPRELQSWMAAGKPLLLIDVREEAEWKTGHAAAALHVPRWTLSSRIASLAPDKGTCIVLYCRAGVRSAGSAATLQMLGYTNVYSLAGGLKNYQSAGLPVLQ